MATTAGLVEPFKTHVEQLLAAGAGRFTLVSGYRTYAQQLQLRKDNGCPDPLHSPPDACAVRPTAIPGTSEHEKGGAVDLGGDLAYAIAIAPRFGIYRPFANDPVHFQPIPGWQPPAVPYVQEDDDMLIDTPIFNGTPSMLVHLHQGKLIWIRKVDPSSPPPWTLDLRGDPDTWHSYLNLFGPVV